MNAAPDSSGELRAMSVPDRYAGLLTDVMSSALDEDYLAVADRRGEGDDGHRRRRPVALVAVLATFGVMLGLSALETERDAPQEAVERAELVQQIRAGQDRLGLLHSDVNRLDVEVTSLQQELGNDISKGGELTDRLTALGVTAGTLEVTGPGVHITVDDAPGASRPSAGVILDTDLQRLVNALWGAGAEAVAIDGHRLTSLTSIRFAGQAITVDYVSLSPPYTIVATGNPNTLPALVSETPAGQYWAGLKLTYGIQFDVVTKELVTVAGDPRDHLLFAEPQGGS